MHDICTNSAPQTFLRAHPTFIHITLNFLTLATFMLKNQDLVFGLILFPFSEPVMEFSEARGSC